MLQAKNEAFFFGEKALEERDNIYPEASSHH